MSAIDVHTHAFPDSLAPRAIATLEAGCPWKAIAGGTVTELLKSMDAADVDVSLVCTIATKPDQVAGIVKWCKGIRSERIWPLPSVHPKTPDAAGWVRRFHDEGFAGIKLHPMYQEFAFDDGSMDEVFAAAAECGVFVTIHCGKDIAYPPEDDRADPARFRRVADRFPNLKMLCTHMGGWHDWEAVEQHLLGANVYLETSFSLADLGPQRAVDLIRRHGVDKVCFGTDWPWSAQDKEIALVRQLGLTAGETDRVLYANAAKLLGM